MEINITFTLLNKTNNDLNLLMCLETAYSDR